MLKNDDYTKIQQTVGFTDTDLKANSIGIIPKSQKQTILRRFQEENMDAIRYAMVLFTPLFGILIWASFERSLLPAIILLGLIFVSTLFMIFYSIQKETNQLKQDLAEDRIVMDSGHVRKLVNKQSRPHKYLLRLGSDNIIITHSLYDALPNQLPITVYYLENACILLSFEIPDEDTVIRELKDEIKYLDYQHKIKMKSS